MKNMVWSKEGSEEGLPEYKHITQNDFLHRKHKKQKEEDVVVCECKYDMMDPEGSCGDLCLNVLTSTECTPGYCRLGVHRKNQRFQKCENAKTKLFKTEGRGWGLLADEDIKGGCFVIEYCGEVISWEEATRRAQHYEISGMKGAYIISLNSNESIDATKKGSLARFINHSCRPNCETRKWTVLGEVRVGIFAKNDIPAGTELAYDYNFQWYGGAKVRCLCGSSGCFGFLGAKSPAFQEDTHLWEEDDERYQVEEIPVYDSAEDEVATAAGGGGEAGGWWSGKEEDGYGYGSLMMEVPVCGSDQFEPTASVVDSFDSIPVEPLGDDPFPAATHPNHPPVAPRTGARSRRRYWSGGAHDPHRERRPKSRPLERERSTVVMTDAGVVPEEHERGGQDSVVVTAAVEKWIRACCSKLREDFDFHTAIIENLLHGTSSSSSHPARIENPPLL